MVPSRDAEYLFVLIYSIAALISSATEPYVVEMCRLARDAKWFVTIEMFLNYSAASTRVQSCMRLGSRSDNAYPFININQRVINIPYSCVAYTQVS